jgi:hypothetical protein
MSKGRRADEFPREDEALGHAAADGHTCGREEALIAFARATLRSVPGADEVFVTPTHTFIVVPHEGHVLRCRNSPEMVAACDRYLLTGSAEHLSGHEFWLLPPDA